MLRSSYLTFLILYIHISHYVFSSIISILCMKQYAIYYVRNRWRSYKLWVRQLYVKVTSFCNVLDKYILERKNTYRLCEAVDDIVDCSSYFHDGAIVRHLQLFLYEGSHLQLVRVKNLWTPFKKKKLVNTFYIILLIIYRI